MASAGEPPLYAAFTRLHSVRSSAALRHDAVARTSAAVSWSCVGPLGDVATFLFHLLSVLFDRPAPRFPALEDFFRLPT